jgi:gluconate 2-dehydrogenase gamma chain
MQPKELTSRRAFLLRAAVPVAGATILGVTHGVASAPKAGRTYKPSYFNAEEWAFVSAAVDRLIPADEAGPGGADAGIPEFIDRQLEMPYGHGAYAYMLGPFQPDLPPTLGYQLPYTPRDLYRRGIAGANKACRAMHGVAFEKLPKAQQDAFLSLLEGTHRGTRPAARRLLRSVAGEHPRGFFADPIYGGNRGMGARS